MNGTVFFLTSWAILISILVYSRHFMLASFEISQYCVQQAGNSERKVANIRMFFHLAGIMLVYIEEVTWAGFWLVALWSTQALILLSTLSNIGMLVLLKDCVYRCEVLTTHNASCSGFAHFEAGRGSGLHPRSETYLLDQILLVLVVLAPWCHTDGKQETQRLTLFDRTLSRSLSFGINKAANLTFFLSTFHTPGLNPACI